MPNRLLWTMRTQGAYYVVTGLWPIIALDHYMRATGQQSHGAVARVLGGVVAGVGVALAAGLIPERARKWVGAGTAVALWAGGTYFGATGHGRAVNFTDAAIQAAFAISWLIDGRRRAS